MKREGRLEEFNARREELRAELKEKGMKRKDAATEAWRQAIDEYPPLPVEEEEEAEEPADPWADIEHRLPPPRPYNGSDTLWAYEHFVRKSTTEDDAPNRGAGCVSPIFATRTRQSGRGDSPIAQNRPNSHMPWCRKPVRSVTGQANCPDRSTSPSGRRIRRKKRTDDGLNCSVC